MYAPNDSTIYFGSRGSGAARLNTKSNEAQILEAPADQGYASNDIYGMVQTDKMHFASGCGLLSFDPANNRLETIDEIPSRATHAILSDDGGNLWISTNYGIICYDTQDRQTTTHNQHSGLYILEYADGAAYKDPENDALFFGGVNGLTIIRNTSKNKEDKVLYTPEINITHHISNNISTLLNGNLKIPYSQNSFGIHFSVVDNTNYSDYEFSYRILGFDEEWKNNGNESTIHLPTLPPGKYTLEIRYHNNSNSYTSEPAQLQITIIPPIYATWWAKTLFLLIVAGICIHYIRHFRFKYLKLKEELRISKALYGLDHSMIANMERIINDNLDNPELSVAFIADRMCISKQSLYRKLENAPDLKPQKLIREARMKAAAEMMKASKLTIDEIMYKVGYDNRSTFYKNFKEQFGLTPKEYRQGKSRDIT
jgi:AraC-like DNA-binding protein